MLHLSCCDALDYRKSVIKDTPLNAWKRRGWRSDSPSDMAVILHFLLKWKFSVCYLYIMRISYVFMWDECFWYREYMDAHSNPSPVLSSWRITQRMFWEHDITFRFRNNSIWQITDIAFVPVAELIFLQLFEIRLVYINHNYLTPYFKVFAIIWFKQLLNL